MTRRMVTGKWPLLGIAAIVIVALAGALVTTQIGAHGGDPDLLHSCINNASGEVKIIGPNDACQKNWTAVDWSTSGAPGEAGPAGRRDLQGPLSSRVRRGPRAPTARRASPAPLAQRAWPDLPALGVLRVPRAPLAPTARRG
jgi:hypothetical protein